MTSYVVAEAHFYSAEIEGELALFDTGPPTPEGVAELHRSVDLKRLRHVFITHCHVDHVGLAGYLEREFGATVYLPRQDALKLRHAKERSEGLRCLLAEAGFEASFWQQLQQVSHAHRGSMVDPEHFQIVEETPVLERLGIDYLVCPGHCQSDVVYCYRGEAVTGDLVLRDIFQVPMLELDLQRMEGRFRNYPAYCESLVKLATLRGMKLLPGHRYYVDDLDRTILFYVRKLMGRAGQVKRFGEREQVSEVLRRLYPAADAFVTHLKVSEIYFMRDFLAEPGLLRQALETIDLFEPVRELYHEVTR